MIFSISKKRNSVRLRIIEKRRVLPFNSEYLNLILAQFPKKGCCLLWHKWMRTLDSHRRNKWYHFWRKTANTLARSFSLKIYRTLSLSTVLTPTNRKSLCTGNVFTLWMLHLLFECCFFERFYGVSSWHQIILCRKDRNSFVSDQEATQKWY